MYGEEIRAFAIVYQGQIVFFESLQIKQKVNHEQELNHMIQNQANQIGKNIQKMSTQSGVWYYSKDSDNTLYFALTSLKYKFPQVSKLIDDIQNRISTAGDLNSLSTQFKNEIYNQLRYYDSNPDCDILSQAQQNVTNIKGMMEDNVNKLVGNQEQLQGIEVKSMELDSMSRQFARDSNQLKNDMRSRMIKQRIFIALIALVFIFGIYFVFFYESGGDDKQIIEQGEQQQQEQQEQPDNGDEN